jgi:hypothetical protein
LINFDNGGGVGDIVLEQVVRGHVILLLDLPSLILLCFSATTYALASYLPSRVLDWLLYLPYQFSTIRATLAPVSPFALPPPPGSLVHSLAKPTPNVADVTETPEHEEKDDVSSGPSSAMYSANISEAGDGAHEETGESWVKLKDEAAAHDGG